MNHYSIYITVIVAAVVAAVEAAVEAAVVAVLEIVLTASIVATVIMKWKKKSSNKWIFHPMKINQFHHPMMKTNLFRQIIHLSVVLV
jgi:hypothetical protein